MPAAVPPTDAWRIDASGAVPAFGDAASDTVSVGSGQEFSAQDVLHAAGQLPFAGP